MARAHALIIDDNHENLEVLAELLAMEDISYTKVRNPLQVDEAVRGIPDVQVVFLDLEMPGLNGYQVNQHLKSIPALKQARVVVYSVHVSEINNVRSSGFNGFLAKPLDADRFPEQIAQILNGQPVWAAV
jgi:CheY-like chemotaxis protein